MAAKDDYRTLQTRWKEMDAVITAERRKASLELRWQQLNSAFDMAQKLGLIREDPSEAEVFAVWAKLKKASNLQPPKA